MWVTDTFRFPSVLLFLTKLRPALSALKAVYYSSLQSIASLFAHAAPSLMHESLLNVLRPKPEDSVRLTSIFASD